MKRRNTTKEDSTKKPRITPIPQAGTEFMPVIRRRKRKRHTLRNTARNSAVEGKPLPTFLACYGCEPPAKSEVVALTLMFTLIDGNPFVRATFSNGERDAGVCVFATRSHSLGKTSVWRCLRFYSRRSVQQSEKVGNVALTKPCPRRWNFPSRRRSGYARAVT